MNFDFSDDEKLFKAEVRRYLEENCSPAQVRKTLEGDAPYDAGVWQGLAALGCMGVTIPENYGGSNLGTLALCVIAEEVGRATAPIPFSSSAYLVTEAILRYGSEAQKQAYLPALATGEAIGTLAVMGEATVKKTHLTGVKSPVLDGLAATFALVQVKTGLYLVDLSQAGVKRTLLNSIDPTRKQAKFEFTNAKAELLTTESLEHLYDVAATYMAFEQLGGAEAALEQAKKYALERKAFGRLIGSYQAIKHKLADMFIKNELARSNAYYAAMMLNDNAADLPLAAATARVAATNCYLYASEENIETHGGIGFTWEANTQFHYRRAQVLGLTLGGKTVWKERLVRQLEVRNI